MDGMVSTELIRLFMNNVWVVYVITHIFSNIGEISIVVTFPSKIEIKFKGKADTLKNSPSDKSNDTSEKGICSSNVH